ncbi:hypothetical protein KY290_035064 [Solanum tuberosum]|uniref:Retrotransposon gag domain-containing protein n=1 Tax=Solanum tuberosum TaxID=4113 RepID=A0ABQ7U6P1_SOLTU|nr:hypothetical protein KY289_034518 [Solanum tuberosum]KAH0646394.1 hypothetical protein KY284_034278 [Solanum tuberosum]KAH0649082.1 hypothetical protein KY285_034330 [Solanum tuberosum]KAH0742021.1 hypothetical protein KY290_035064 [Solanum tuberosum]
MEQEIDGIKEMIADLKNSSNENSLDYNFRDSSDEDLEGYSPIRATGYPNFDCNTQHFLDMHPLPQNEAFDDSSETSKDGENDQRHFNAESNQIFFTNELAPQLGTNLVEKENENDTHYNLVDILMYDRTGLPQNHIKAYLDWLASIGKGNEFNIILFIRTLTGPALMWYANQDTRKWLSWVDLTKDFIKQYRPPNSASKGCGLLKRKSIESPEGMKGHESQNKVAK